LSVGEQGWTIARFEPLLVSSRIGPQARHIANTAYSERLPSKKQSGSLRFALDSSAINGITALEAAGVFGERKPASSFEFGLRMWIKAASSKP
jgi:hypothetical protein